MSGVLIREGGTAISDPKVDGRPYDEQATPWRAWSPAQAARRLNAVRTVAGRPVRWAVAAGWAIDLHLGHVSRAHSDLEIAALSDDAPAVLEHFTGSDWRWVVPLEGRLHAFDSPAFAQTHQTWLWSVPDDAFVLDVFRESHDGDTWICRRDASIRRPWQDTVLTSAEGVPYLAPEAVLLFKAKATRDKDVHDLHCALPTMDLARRAWLAGALRTVHPGHPWTEVLADAG